MPSTQPIKITVSKDQWEKLTQQLNYLFKDIYHYLDKITGVDNKTFTTGGVSFDDWFDQAVKVASTPKFAANLHRRTIPSGTTITVPDDYEFIVGNGYNIEGVLDIQGSGALFVI